MMHHSELSDIELLERIKCDDISAFNTLFHRMWEPLYLFAYKRLKSKPDAEDVVQQVFMTIWERRATKNITSSFSNYLFTAVRYEVIDQLEKMTKDAQKTIHIEEDILPTFENALDGLFAKEMDQQIADYINNMPQQMQRIFRLSREEQLSPKEISETLSISEKTVRNQLSIAMNNLRPLVKTLILTVFFHT